LNEELRTKIQKVLDDQIRPRLQFDGGDIQLVDVSDDGVVKVRLTGGCQGCPMAGLTMAMTVERILKATVPEVTRIQPVEEVSEPVESAQAETPAPSAGQ
jgi:Fe-S cluster biogenesis protein NfuA